MVFYSNRNNDTVLEVELTKNDTFCIFTTDNTRIAMVNSLKTSSDVKSIENTIFSLNNTNSTAPIQLD